MNSAENICYTLLRGIFCLFRVVYYCSCYSFNLWKQWKGLFHYICQSLQRSSVISHFRRWKPLTPFRGVVCVQNEGFALTMLRRQTQNIKQIFPYGNTLGEFTRTHFGSSLNAVNTPSPAVIDKLHIWWIDILSLDIITRVQVARESMVSLNVSPNKLCLFTWLLLLGRLSSCPIFTSSHYNSYESQSDIPCSLQSHERHIVTNHRLLIVYATDCTVMMVF